MGLVNDILRAQKAGNVAEKGSFKTVPVGRSADLDRISLQYDWDPDPKDIDTLAALLTNPGATMTLREIQARALYAASQAGGLFAPIGVGQGKTLTAALLPTVLGKRALILTMPTLVQQAQRMTAEYRRHFLIRNDFRWVGYSTLSCESGQHLLEEFQPELIIADECHHLKNPDATRTKRFLRYMRKHKPAFCAMSGTITKRSILDFGHLISLALGWGSPLPLNPNVLREWAEAFDVPKTGAPRPAGELGFVFGKPPRDGWGKKFRRTKGVVVGGEEDIGASLILENYPLAKVPAMEELVKRLETRWERPDGEQLTTALEVARVRRELRLGGHHKWVWPLGMGIHKQTRWLVDRRGWLIQLRELMKAHGDQKGLDSPLLMSRAVAQGQFPDAFPAWETWKTTELQIEGPTSEWVQITKEPLEEIVERVEEPCVIWTDIVAVGHAIARIGKFPYFGAGDDKILDEKGNRTIVASIQAHGTGRNLQCFSRAIVAGGGPDGSMWQQLLGRHHRPGQTADEVIVQVLFWDEVQAARADAKYQESVTGEAQKLLYANIVDLEGTNR